MRSKKLYNITSAKMKRDAYKESEWVLIWNGLKIDV